MDGSRHGKVDYTEKYLFILNEAHKLSKAERDRFPTGF